MKMGKFCVFLLGTTLIGGYTLADDGYENPHKQSKGKLTHEQRHEEDTASLILPGITAAEARILAKEYHVKKAKPLPPGIRKNLARGKPLPPGIAKQALPQPMLDALPHYDGYEWHRQGADLILVSVASAVIADVLFDVFE